MKNVVKALSITVAILLLTATQVVAQQTLPDYTKWDKTFSENFSAVHKGKNVNLSAEFYINLDVDNLYYHTALVFYDENKHPWIVLYTRVAVYKDGNELVPVSTNYWLFETSNKSWSFVKDFSQSKDLDKETAEFLKSRYDLELK